MKDGQRRAAQPRRAPGPSQRGAGLKHQAQSPRRPPPRPPRAQARAPPAAPRRRSSPSATPLDLEVPLRIRRRLVALLVAVALGIATHAGAHVHQRALHALPLPVHHHRPRGCAARASAPPVRGPQPHLHRARERAPPGPDDRAARGVVRMARLEARLLRRAHAKLPLRVRDEAIRHRVQHRLPRAPGEQPHLRARHRRALRRQHPCLSSSSCGVSASTMPSSALPRRGRRAAPGSGPTPAPKGRKPSAVTVASW